MQLTFITNGNDQPTLRAWLPPFFLVKYNAFRVNLLEKTNMNTLHAIKSAWQISSGEPPGSQSAAVSHGTKRGDWEPSCNPSASLSAALRRVSTCMYSSVLCEILREASGNSLGSLSVELPSLFLCLSGPPVPFLLFKDTPGHLMDFLFSHNALETLLGSQRYQSKFHLLWNFWAQYP